MTGNHNHNNPGWYTTPPTPACQTNARRISDYLSHTLSPSDSASLEQHLAACSYCTALLNSYSLFDQQIKSLPNPPASPRVHAAVMNAIAASEADKRSLKPVRMAGVTNRAPRLASSMAALAMLAAFAGALGLMLSGRGLLPPATPALASPTAGVPASITPAIDNPIALGTQTLMPVAVGTPLPSALMVQPVQASPAESSTNLVFTSVDSAGMTQTIATPPDKLVSEARPVVSHDGRLVAYSTEIGGKVKLQIYNLMARQVIASVDMPAPSSNPNYAYAYKYAPSASFSLDDKQVAYNALNFDGSEAQGVLDITTGATTSTIPSPSSPPLPKMGCCISDLIGWGVDGFIYMGSAGEGQTGERLYTISPNGQPAKDLKSNYDLIDHPWMDKSGQFIYAASYSPDATPNKQAGDLLLKYDVKTGTYSVLARLDVGVHIYYTHTDELANQGIFAEPADDSSLLYIETGKQPGSLEIRRAGLRTPIDNSVAQVKAPDGDSNVAVSAMQVCGATVFYQTISNDSKGQQQTQLVAQPLSGGAAKVLPTQGQLIGCSASR